MIMTLSDLSVLKFMYRYLRFLFVLWNSVALNLPWSLVVDHSTLIWVLIHYAYRNQRWWKTSAFDSSWYWPLQRSILAAMQLSLPDLLPTPAAMVVADATELFAEVHDTFNFTVSAERILRVYDIVAYGTWWCAPQHDGLVTMDSAN